MEPVGVDCASPREELGPSLHLVIRSQVCT